MANPRKDEVGEEGRFHSYHTHRIPWYLRAIWIVFWIGAIYYAVKWLIPSVKDYF